jgi:hypothetical protein
MATMPGVSEGQSNSLHDSGWLVRVKGQAPIAATVYELQKLRCNLCGEVFTAEAPEGVGEEKYDATTARMIALHSIAYWPDCVSCIGFWSEAPRARAAEASGRASQDGARRCLN